MALQEGEVRIERGRCQDNIQRPHLAHGYRQSTPETRLISRNPLAYAALQPPDQGGQERLTLS